ncbi:MAG: preprotein translocase subunit SecG [Bryobacteraceae bacterium]
MLTIGLTVLHFIVCFFLIVVVLLQSGKAADLAGAFGGMGSQTAFGPRGSATVLSKATTVAAVLFMLTSLGLTILTTRSGGGGSGSTVMERNAPKGAPAAPKKGGQPEIQVTPTPGGQPVTVPATPESKQSAPPKK